MSKWSTHIALAFFACAFLAVQAQTNRETEWWESASLYQIYPRSFQDSDGNGIGDLKGITQRLSYLKEIGITATWLSPIWKSPMADFGYDISDYFMVDPIFGTMEDFDAMMEEAKRLGIKIILDFVPNHTSDECEWFQKSIKREAGYEDFYVWNDGKVDPNDPTKRLPPSNWVSVFGGPMWTWVEERGQYYLHQFLDKQPDLNYTNPMVRKQMLEVLEFWLDKGVAGFRLDATPHIFEAINDDGTYDDEPVSGWSNDPNDYTYHDHIYTKDQYPTIELMYEWREFVDQYRAKNGGEVIVLIAEAFSPIEVLNQYFGNGTHMGTQLPMNFNLMYLSSQANARDIEGSCNYWMDTMWKIHQTANWVIGNHDNGRVKNRVGKQKVDAWNLIVNSLPGASITYYGEEIGMSDVPIISNEDRDPERTPMQWSPTRMAGFTEGDSTWLPIAEDYRTFNVQTERGVARSTLELYKGIQSLKQTAAFKAVKQPGGFSYGALNDQVFQIVRSAANVEEYRTLVNLGDKVEKLHNISDKTMEYVLMNSYSPHVKGEKVNLRDTLYLMPYESIVLRWVPL